MKEKERSLGSRILRRFRSAPAQSMVEFAIALPILLLLVFGIVEFGRLLQAWLALENGARFGIRYAVTGEFNPQYCDEAAAALSLTAVDADHDCVVVAATGATNAQRELARDQTQLLQDWARMPSIRDAAMSGASGIAYDEAVSGNYLQYLATPGNTFNADYRGDPSQPGFFYISICSNRHVTPTSGTDDNTKHFYTQQAEFDPFYFPGFTDNNHLFFPTVCTLYDNPIGKFMDDAGGPGDRVRITLTYRHNMIMPLLSDWWPTLRLNTARDGIVEKFRTSRVTGLSEGNMIPDTPTFTPTASDTFTVTPTDTETPTSTATPTSTNTLVPCVTGGNGIRAEYYNYTGSAPPANPFTSPIVINIIPNINTDWSDTAPAAGLGNNYFAIRYVGQVMPLFTESYTFTTKNDDGVRLWVNGMQLVNNWANQGWDGSQRSGSINLTRCQKYDIVMEFFENTGNARVRLRWSSPSQSEQVVPQDNLFSEMGTVPTATVTITPTVTLTSTISMTPTITQTPTITPTPSRTLVPSITNTRVPTRTRTNVPPPTQTYTVTNTEPPPPTNTSTDIPPTKTNTSPPPTRTHTLNVPTATRTVSPTFKPIGG